MIDQVADGDRVATRWRLEGTHSNRLLGIEASHRFVCVEGIRIDRIDRGRIAETWNQWDVLGMLRQLGALQIDRSPGRASCPAAAIEAG